MLYPAETLDHPKVAWAACVPVVVVCAIFAAAWLATWPAGDMPLNDDWVYGNAVRSILETGRFTLQPWSSANVIAQAYWGAAFAGLFGFSYEVLRFSTFVLAELGLVAGYLLLREIGASTRDAVLGALTLGLSPLYLSLSTTFMTDVPFTTLVLSSLYCFVAGSGRGNRALVVAAYGLAVAAVFVRQFAILVPLAFALAELARGRRVAAALAVAAVVVLTAMHLGFQRWMLVTHRTGEFATPIGDLLSPSLTRVWRAVRTNLLLVLPLLGLLTAPFLVAGVRSGWPSQPERWVSRGVQVAAGLGLFWLMMAKQALPPAFGNVMTPFGVGPLTLTDCFTMGLNLPSLPFEGPFWLALGVVAAVAAVRLCVQARAAAWVGVREPEKAGIVVLLLAFCIAYVGAMLALSTIGSVFDRYVIVLVIPLCGLMVVAGRGQEFAPAREAGWTRGGFPLGCAMVAAMGVFSIAGTHDWLAWNRTRIEAVRQIVASGVPAEAVDGGYEFNGPLRTAPGFTGETGQPAWWPGRGDVSLGCGKRPGYRIESSAPFKPWLWRGLDRVFVLRRE